MNVRQAKDFLVNQTAQQAAIDGVPLSELEKRMMYFSESDPTCEDPIALNDEFEAQYSSEEYEPKISGLLKRAHRRIRNESPETRRKWDNAVRTLRKGDHYIVVMLGSARVPGTGSQWVFYVAAILGVALFYSLMLFVFGSRKRSQPAPIDKYLPALSPTAEHVMQALFVLILVFAFLPNTVSKPAGFFFGSTRAKKQ